MQIWEMAVDRFGFFMAQIPPPLGIGTVKLEDGGSVYGFICEGFIKEGGPNIEDITEYGGWVGWLNKDAKK